MIIDFHTHTFPDELAPRVIPRLEKFSKTTAFNGGTIAELQKAMFDSNVDFSVNQPVATHANQVITCNDFAISINSKYDNLISFGTMHPDFPDYDNELTRIKNLGIKGIKLHPNYQETYFDDIKYKRIVYKANELDLIVLTHAGIDIGLPEPVYATPQIIKNLISDVHPEKLVLAHMGGCFMWDEVIETLAGENVYLDTAFAIDYINYTESIPQEERIYSMLSEEILLKMVEIFSPDKILFATDNPWCSQKDVISYLQKLTLSDVDKAKVLGENAKILLNI
ncbi:MAG: amidohydrolase family protein [Clostridia bacterium]